DVPDVPDELHHLAQPRARRGPRRRVAALVVTLHLRAEPEHEAAPRSLLEIPGDLRVDERAAREGDGDVGADGDALGGRRGERTGEIRIVARLGRPEPVVAHGLGGARPRGDVAQVPAHEPRVDQHALPYPLGCGRGKPGPPPSASTAAKSWWTSAVVGSGTPRRAAAASASRRSFCCSRTMNPGAKSRRCMRGPKLASIHEAAAPPPTAATTCAGSSPARAASTMPSATAASVTAPITW